MPRRRAERQQEKEEFLQQNPELITYTTRIEVDGPDHGEDDFDAVASQNGGPFENLFVRDEDDGPGFLLTNQIEGPGFAIFGGETTSELEPGLGGGLFPIVDPALVSLTENGFGITGEEEDKPELPDGLDTIDEGELLGVAVFDDGEDYGEDDEGGVSFGIDFTASGRGSVEITLFTRAGPKEEFGEQHTETFDIPFGTQPGDLLSFEVDAPNNSLFNFAQVATNGGASISVVGIDLETSFQGVFPDPA